MPKRSSAAITANDENADNGRVNLRAIAVYLRVSTSRCDVRSQESEPLEVAFQHPDTTASLEEGIDELFTLEALAKPGTQVHLAACRTNTKLKT